jgi:hypothetical protein
MSRELSVAGALLKDKWYWSTDECRWSSDRPFAMREQAIEDALAEGSKYFFTGRGEPILLREVMIRASDVIDNLVDNLQQEVGEVSDSWLDHVSKESEEELDEELFAAINGWLIRNERRLGHFKITEVRTHKVEPDGTLTASTGIS